MLIKSIELENWKCFSSEMQIDFSLIEIISMPNGSGKTSILEAIIYGLYGKTDGKLERYQNHEGQTHVKIVFEIDGCEYIIDREFPNNKATLYRSGEKFKNGAREIFEYMNSLLDYNITKRIWFKGEVSTSEVLDFKFFKKDILAEKLKTPNDLYQLYHSEELSKNKQIKQIIVEETRDLKDINKDIEELTNRLKEKSNITDTQYAKAVQVKESKEKFEELDLEIEKLINKEDINRWKSLDLNNLIAKLEKEQAKIVDENLSNISNSVLNSIVKDNDHANKCVICEGDWKEERSNYIKDIIQKGFQDSNLIKQYREQIEYKKSIKEEDIIKSEEYYKLEEFINSMPNFQEVLDKFNKENDALWDKLQEYNREKERAISNQSKIEEINKLEKERLDCKEKAAFLKDYINKATESYTSSLLEKSSETLNDINPEYTDISIDGEDSSINVLVKGENLNITQLSRGERTIVALSLITSIRDIFTPGLPLIFDESFSALDPVNNNSVIQFLRDSQDQLFIITHNKDWTEYKDYNYETTIRTEW